MRELDAFLNNGDSTCDWKLVGDRQIEVTTQTWMGQPWRHPVTLSGPMGVGDCAILMITGGCANELDEEEAMWLARTSGLPVVTLYEMPNQPLFEELWEDDLIAFSFIQYLATGDAAWPLLFPMAKSVVRAMDAIQSWTNGQFQRFVVTGLSKRGWTTWMTAATGDPRVAGIAPMVIDHLNIPAQMEHQLATWGCYSEQIRSYTELDLPKKLDSPEGLSLNRMIDPFDYLDRYTQPILIMNGSNDPYWQVDALKLYWDALPNPKWASIVLNAGHLLGDKVAKIQTLSAFARQIAAKQPITTPTWHWEHRPDESRLSVEALAGHNQTRIWRASSETYDFRESRWQVAGDGQCVRPGKERFTALLGEMECRLDDLTFSLTTPAEVLDRSGR